MESYLLDFFPCLLKSYLPNKNLQGRKCTVEFLSNYFPQRKHKFPARKKTTTRYSLTNSFARLCLNLKIELNSTDNFRFFPARV